MNKLNAEQRDIIVAYLTHEKEKFIKFGDHSSGLEYDFNSTKASMCDMYASRLSSEDDYTYSDTEMDRFREILRRAAGRTTYPKIVEKTE